MECGGQCRFFRPHPLDNLGYGSPGGRPDQLITLPYFVQASNVVLPTGARHSFKIHGSAPFLRATFTFMWEFAVTGGPFFQTLGPRFATHKLWEDPERTLRSHPRNGP